MNDKKKYWPAKITLCFIRILALLPFKLGISIGTFLGYFLYFTLIQRRKITAINIAICFPELSTSQQKRLVKQVFVANGIGLVETAWSHYAPMNMFDNKIEVKGQSLLDAALSQNKGVILLGAHFSTLDLGGLLFSYTKAPLNTLYRQHNNPLLDKAIYEGRSRYCNPIERKNMREVIRKLKDNQCVWFAPDQDLKGKGNVFVDFFGQTASTVTATSNMMRFNHSPLLMLAHYRKPDKSGYILEFSEVPIHDDINKDELAQTVNDVIEKAIRKYPEQYMWMHKRFKTQPDGKLKLYQSALK